VSDVFNEVDEELRKEVANRLFRKFLPLIIIVVVLVMIGGKQSKNQNPLKHIHLRLNCLKKANTKRH
jgi:hypothetical protein